MKPLKNQIVIWDNGEEYSDHTIYFVEVEHSAREVASALDFCAKYKGFSAGGRVIGTITKGDFGIEETCGIADVLYTSDLLTFYADGVLFKHGVIEAWLPLTELIVKAYANDHGECAALFVSELIARRNPQ